METTVWLTPGEAAAGVVKTISLPSGPVSVRIPPVGDNAVINVPTSEGEVSVRVRVSDATPSSEAPTAQVPSGEEPTSLMPPTTDQPNVPPFGAAAASPFEQGPGSTSPFGAAGASSPFDAAAGGAPAFGATPPYGAPSPYGMPPYGMPPKKQWYQKPGPWIAAGIVVLVGTLIGFAVAGSPSPSPVVVAQGTGTPTATSGPEPTSTSSSAPEPTSTYAPPTTLAPTPTSAPLSAGQCLSGTLPTSSTPVSVTGVDVVSCSSSSATYKIIQTFDNSTDLNDCNNVSSSQDVYAFSDQETWNGVTLWSAVYCAVQL